MISEFTPGEIREITLSREKDSWVVTKPSTDSRTVCFFTDSDEPDLEDAPLSLTGRIERYRQSSGGRADYLTVAQVDEDTTRNNSKSDTQSTSGGNENDTESSLSDVEAGDEPTSTGGESTNQSTSSSNGTDVSSTARDYDEYTVDDLYTDNNSQSENIKAKSESKYPEQKLFEFNGSGDYVTVEAKVVEIEYIQKTTPNMPDLKGVLRGSTSKKVPFVVEEDAGHPRFEEGSKFRFEGVKDHRYEKENEVQVFITKKTQITEL